MKRRYVIIGALTFACGVFWTIAVEWIPFSGYKLGHKLGLSEQRDFYFRLLAEHPAGSSEKALIEALHQQGFKTRPSNDPNYENVASFRARGLFCEREWLVFWWTGRTDRITDITSRVYLHCPYI